MITEPAAARGPAGQRLEITLAGLPAALSSSHTEFMQYAAEHVSPLRRDDGHPASVEATLVWHEAPPPVDRLKAYPEIRTMERIDRDVYRSATEIAWFRIDELPALHLRLAWDGQRLRVHGDFYLYLSRNPYRNWLQRGLRRRHLAQLRHRRFTTLLYYLVYYPCFWVLERTQDLHPIHAGGVEIQGHVVVFAGPSGVGKSTLITGLAGDPRARLMSDTFLLHRGSTVRAVPEPLLLDAWSQHWVNDANVNLHRLVHRYSLSRNGFHWPPDRSSLGGIAEVLVFPHRSDSDYLRLLPPSNARGRLSAVNMIVNDLRRYWAFASVLELLDPTPLVYAREHQITKLTDQVPAYELGFSPNITPTNAAAAIMGILEPPGDAHRA